jgi:hypothetical protein
LARNPDPKIPIFGFFWENFSGFWDFWDEKSHIFGTLGLVWLGISWDFWNFRFFWDFRASLGYLSQSFGDFWVGFGTYGSCLAWDVMGFGCPNSTHNTRFFWVQIYACESNFLLHQLN